MIKYNLKALMLDKSFSENRKITYEDVSRATGISKPTLSKIASRRGYVTSTSIIEKLCQYFECSCNELITIIPDEKF